MPRAPTVSDEDIDRDISLRGARHKLGILELQNSSHRIVALNGGHADGPVSHKMTRPLCILAAGDSWFDYPLLNNSFSSQGTDIIAQLKHYGSVPPRIYNLAHFGEASTDSLAPQKKRRLIAALTDNGNWIGGKPDAILFSAGGNDVAGDQFRNFLNKNEQGNEGLNRKTFGQALKVVKASYLELFALRDAYAKDVPVFAHTYGFVIPNGESPRCAGPWLQPSLVDQGWTSLDDGTAIVTEMLGLFHDMLADLERDPSHRFHVIRSHKLLEPEDWANELHPTYLGFRKVVRLFDSVLKTLQLNS